MLEVGAGYYLLVEGLWFLGFMVIESVEREETERDEEVVRS
jgi:hypothetical protein